MFKRGGNKGSRTHRTEGGGVGKHPTSGVNYHGVGNHKRRVPGGLNCVRTS